MKYNINLIDVIWFILMIPIGIIAMTITLTMIGIDFVTSFKDSFLYSITRTRK